MSKNIEEIVESVLPAGMVIPIEDNDIGHPLGIAKAMLKQALTKGKLVVPMSENQIREMANDWLALSLKESGGVNGLAKRIYEAQFNDK